MKTMLHRITLAIVAASTLVGITTMSSAQASRSLAFERALAHTAPPGYAAYVVRLWGTAVRGQLASVTLTEDGMLKFNVDGEHQLDVERVATDTLVESIIYLRSAFQPSSRLLALPVRRPIAISDEQSSADRFTLRFVNVDPDDPMMRIYEAHAKAVVYYGTVLGFHLDEASEAAGYPYRGPFSFSGSVKFRLSRYAGEKSVFRIPMSVKIPDVLIER